jgi:hypothetical protein
MRSQRQSHHCEETVRLSIRSTFLQIATPCLSRTDFKRITLERTSCPSDRISAYNTFEADQDTLHRRR